VHTFGALNLGQSSGKLITNYRFTERNTAQRFGTNFDTIFWLFCTGVNVVYGKNTSDPGNHSVSCMSHIQDYR